MSSELEIVDLPEPLGRFAGQLYDRAEQYLTAYDKLAAVDALELPYPTYFLLQHAVELYLKASLAAKGVSKRHLLGLRHDLNRLLALCDEHGVSRTAEFGYLVRDIHENSRDHDFRYPTNYNLRVPSKRLVDETILPFRDRIKGIIQYARITAQLEHAESTRHLRGTARIRFSD